MNFWSLINRILREWLELVILYLKFVVTSKLTNLKGLEINFGYTSWFAITFCDPCSIRWPMARICLLCTGYVAGASSWNKADLHKLWPANTRDHSRGSVHDEDGAGDTRDHVSSTEEASCAQTHQGLYSGIRRPFWQASTTMVIRRRNWRTCWTSMTRRKRGFRRYFNLWWSIIWRKSTRRSDMAWYS